MNFSPIYGYIVIYSRPFVRRELNCFFTATRSTTTYSALFCAVGHADSLRNSPHKTMTRVGLEPSIILVSRFGWISLAIDKSFFTLVLQPSLVPVFAGGGPAI